MLTGTPLNNYAAVVSAYTNEDSNTYRIITQQKQTDSYYVNGNSKAGGGSVLHSAAMNTIHEGYIRNGVVTIDGTNVSTTTQGDSIASSASLTILSNGFVGRVYRAYAEQNSGMRYDMIPVRRVSDNKCGMYDVESGTFFTSASSTAFTCP